MSVLNAAGPTATSAQPSAQPSSTGGSSGTSQFNQINSQQFMRLLTTQLQHQDPTNPVSETQLASEMAQFSMATGIDTLNSSVSRLINGQAASQLASATALIGKHVALPGNALVTDASGRASGAFVLAGPAKSVSVQILDDNGQVIDTLDLGTMDAGTQSFQWKSGVPSTAFAFNVSAADTAGGPVVATPRSTYIVSGVEQQNGQTLLTLAGSSNPLPLSDATHVF